MEYIVYLYNIDRLILSQKTTLLIPFKVVIKIGINELITLNIFLPLVKDTSNFATPLKKSSKLCDLLQVAV